MPFDPDAYLASKPSPGPAFDPNVYLGITKTPEGMRPVRPGEIPTASGFLPLPPEEPQRTLGQRGMGAIAAPLDVAATLVSGAGRAAATLPYALVTGRGIEPGFRELMQGVRQPQTPEGRAMLEAAAPALEALPPIVGTGPAVLGAGVPAAQQAGRVVGQEARLIGGAIEQARAGRAEKQALARSAEDWARAPQIEAANRAVELGIALNPAVSNPTLPNRAKSTLVGNRDVNAMLAKQNAPKWTELAKRDMGISTQTPLNAKGFEEARNAVSGPYEQLRRMGTMTASDDVRRALDGLRIEEAAIGAEPSAKRVNRLVDEAFGKIEGGLDGKRVLDSIRQLRRDAQAIRNAQKVGQAPSPEKIAEADAKMRIAGVLENMVEENIFDPKFKDEFRSARTALAKTYAYEDATDFNTGQIDPVAISRLTASDNALTGIIADIGAIAGNFPEIASAGAPSTLLQRAGSHLTRSGVTGTLGAAIGAATPIGPIGGGVIGAAAGELATGLRARKIGTPEYQRKFAAPQDRRIFPTQVNELAPPTPGTPALYDWRNALLTEDQMPYQPNWVFGQTPPEARFVGPQAGPPALPAPSAEATMAGLRAEDVRRAGVSRAIGQEAEARQAAAEAAARRPAGEGVPLVFDERGNLVPASTSGVGGVVGAPSALESAVQKLSGEMIAPTETQFRRISTGKWEKKETTQGPKFYVKGKTTEGPSTREPRAFDLTAEEKIAWDKAKAGLAEVAPGMKALTDKAIAERMMDRAWVDDAVKKAREKAEGFARIEAKAKDAAVKRRAAADRERMLDLLETLEDRFRAPRTVELGGQGPKTRAAKAAANPGRTQPPRTNNLLEP